MPVPAVDASCSVCTQLGPAPGPTEMQEMVTCCNCDKTGGTRAA